MNQSTDSRGDVMDGVDIEAAREWAKYWIGRTGGVIGEELQIPARAILALIERTQWRSIASAPRDGRAIFVLSKVDEYTAGGRTAKNQPRCAIASWNPDGDSWVDEHGVMGRDSYRLETTGFWSSGGGWFQPNEVTHWMPLPFPPSAVGQNAQGDGG